MDQQTTPGTILFIHGLHRRQRTHPPSRLSESVAEIARALRYLGTAQMGGVGKLPSSL